MRLLVCVIVCVHIGWMTHARRWIDEIRGLESEGTRIVPPLFMWVDHCIIRGLTIA